MSKIWTVSVTKVISTPDRDGVSGHFVMTREDLGTYPTRTKAVVQAAKFLKDEDWSKEYETDDEVVYKYGNKQELLIESIYLGE